MFYVNLFNKILNLFLKYVDIQLIKKIREYLLGKFFHFFCIVN
ncbi:hypothetical protein ASZ90_008332 [hydrocarbon metagenome]|uniref:Uncharacterized protein n=1 Tax=hydrocarbon metagenome TaxID=938273 RepID=A0A0W8FNI4_9ZZZZ